MSRWVRMARTPRSARLLLRPPRGSDAPELSALLRRNEGHLRPWQPVAPPGPDPLAPASMRREIAAQRRDWRADRAYSFLVLTREPVRPIVGSVRFGAISRQPFHNAYLGYWIDGERQGEGLMTEAVRLALGFAFETLGLHRVQAAVIPRNAPSRRVLAKTGFREEGLARRYLEIAGVWEDHVIHALTREEWPGRPPGTHDPLC